MLRSLFGHLFEHFNVVFQWVALILLIGWLRPPRPIIATNFAKTLATKHAANSKGNKYFAKWALICGTSMRQYFAQKNGDISHRKFSMT